jgi:hypothetical protein
VGWGHFAPRLYDTNYHRLGVHKILRIFRPPADYFPMTNHISDHDLERYHLGMVKREAELAALEEHCLGCPECAERARAAADYVDGIRAGIVEGNFDLDYLGR